MRTRSLKQKLWWIYELTWNFSPQSPLLKLIASSSPSHFVPQYCSPSQVVKPLPSLFPKPSEIPSLFQTSSWIILTDRSFYLWISAKHDISDNLLEAEISLSYPFPKIEREKFQEFNLNFCKRHGFLFLSMLHHHLFDFSLHH